MIDVVYSPKGNWGLVLPVLAVLLLLSIGSIVLYKAIIKIFKKHIDKKAQNKVATIIFFAFAFILFIAPFDRLVGENKGLSKSQYETSITGSVLSIKSKDPKLESDKMYFRIKKGTAIQFVQKLEVAPLNEQSLIVYVKWSDHKKNSNSEKVSEMIVSRESLNLQEE